MALAVVVASLASAQVKLPPFQKTVLPNGVTVIVVPRPGLPLAGFHIVVKGGNESEPKELAGISGVTASLLRRGTAKRTAEAFSDELDGLGGELQIRGDDQSTVIVSEFLKKDFDHGLELTADAVLHPAFPEAEVRKFIAQRVDAAKAAKDNPQFVIAQYFRAFFYGPEHPYGHPADELTLARISRDRIAEYHKRLFVGRNLIVVISGDLESTAMLEAARRVFGEIPEGTAYQWASDAKPAGVGKSRMLLIDKPDATQTYFYIGQPGIPRSDPERTPVDLVNRLFGGRFTSMLNDALRVNSGLTYGAASRLEENRLPGSLVITSYTKTDTTQPALDMALDVLKRLREKGIDAAQLASVKAYEKGLFPTQRLETPEQIAERLSEIELFGLNRGEVDDLFSRIDAVTLERANDVARRRFRDENLTFVLIGNAAKIREQVKKYAPSVTEVSIKTPGFAVN